MTENLTQRQSNSNNQSKWAVYLPAISGFYGTFIGKQRVEEYVDPARFPNGLADMEQLNWLNSQKSIFPYKWSLYSGGHANLDLTKVDPSEDMVRSREPGSFMLGDSGGFQIAKGLWPGEWKDPTSSEVVTKMAQLKAQGVQKIPVLKNGQPVFDKKGNQKFNTVDPAADYQKQIDAADNKRKAILTWLDSISDYCMTLDIPTWVVNDKKAGAACQISTVQQAIDATKFNNEYFMKHRKGKNNGGTKILNVLQGDRHESADEWYETMKDYCDPTIYPDTHFDGWAMGGQNMCDIHLILKRFIALRHDNLLQQGKHDWMHFLGTSMLEWAVLLTVIQNAVRRHINPDFTISFDCASPFLATANGQVYCENVFPHDKKWSYRMEPSADDRKYATDTRLWNTGVKADGIHENWTASPISDMWEMKDICIYKPGDLNKVGKEGKTSWDSFSYALLMAHNVYMHITAVQEANERFERGEHPSMMRQQGGEYKLFEDIVEEIFAESDKQKALDLIDQYEPYWNQIRGTRGESGKKAKNSKTMYNKHTKHEITHENPNLEALEAELKEWEKQPKQKIGETTFCNFFE